MDNFDEKMEDNLFTRGNDDKETFLEKVQGCVCAAVFFAGLLTYLLLGIIGGFWHPYWVIIVAGAFLSGIVGCVFDLFNAEKRNEKIAKGENPYSGAICGIIILACLLTYFLLGAFLNLWHPLWIIPVAGIIVSVLVASIGKILSSEK